MKLEECFNTFQEDVSSYPIPKLFTYPFYYSPHPLCEIAAKEIQDYLKEQTHWKHNFGLDSTKESLPIGKMFGVLIVKNEFNQIGYLSTYSGKLQGETGNSPFVPPINSSTTENEFKLSYKVEVDQINKRLNILKHNPIYIELQKDHALLLGQQKSSIDDMREQMRVAKKRRKEIRNQEKPKLLPEQYTELEKNLIKESLSYKYQLKKLTEKFQSKLDHLNLRLSPYKDSIYDLELSRKNILQDLQEKTLNQYQFLNILGDTKSLINIFKEEATYKPTSGTGDCAAPKLLQFAFKNNLTPVAIAEFWWGAPHKSTIRKHMEFYPACASRCKPILTHMLKGMDVEQNPMLIHQEDRFSIETIFEDEYLLVINKPSGLLSVPGKQIKDSIEQRIKLKYPKATGPMIVHRLDQDTSGIMLIAKTKEVHKNLQKQFITRAIKKRYCAVLEGLIPLPKGTISLPLRGDPDNRPHQLVCFDHGKLAKTEYKILSTGNNKTYIYFYPITGRTHQLRIHSAHNKGLNTPIIGDDLYGKKSTRLHLHADWIEFCHPTTQNRVSFQSPHPF